MIAAVYHAPGDVRVEDMPQPRDPVGADVILEVTRAAICGTDASEFTHTPKFFPIDSPHPFSGHFGPTIMGHEFTGRVVARGSEGGGLSIGDRVVCGAGVSCGTCEWCLRGRTNLCARYYTLGLHSHGGLAQYVSTPASLCRVVPETCSDDARTCLRRGSRRRRRHARLDGVRPHRAGRGHRAHGDRAARACAAG